MRISDWSSDVCSSDLDGGWRVPVRHRARAARSPHPPGRRSEQATTPPSDSTAAAPRPGPQPLAHTVSTEPFDPYSIERMSAEQERYYMASQWRMMWWK